MMNKYLSISLSIILLIGIIVGTIFWIRAFNESVENFESPLREANLSPQPYSLPKMTNVVVVLVSGLGYDDSLDVVGIHGLGGTWGRAIDFCRGRSYAVHIPLP